MKYLSNAILYNSLERGTSYLNFSANHTAQSQSFDSSENTQQANFVAILQSQDESRSKLWTISKSDLVKFSYVR